MYMLSDEALLEAYQKAIQLRLDYEFIQLLFEEIRLRDLDKHLQGNHLSFEEEKNEKGRKNIAISY